MEIFNNNTSGSYNFIVRPNNNDKSIVKFVLYFIKMLFKCILIRLWIKSKCMAIIWNKFTTVIFNVFKIKKAIFVILSLKKLDIHPLRHFISFNVNLISNLCFNLNNMLCKLWEFLLGQPVGNGLLGCRAGRIR